MSNTNLASDKVLKLPVVVSSNSTTIAASSSNSSLQPASFLTSTETDPAKNTLKPVASKTDCTLNQIENNTSNYTNNNPNNSTMESVSPSRSPSTTSSSSLSLALDQHYYENLLSSGSFEPCVITNSRPPQHQPLLSQTANIIYHNNASLIQQQTPPVASFINYPSTNYTESYLASMGDVFSCGSYNSGGVSSLSVCSNGSNPSLNSMLEPASFYEPVVNNAHANGFLPTFQTVSSSSKHDVSVGTDASFNKDLKCKFFLLVIVKCNYFGSHFIS
jgi:hypothetical protein